MLKQSLAYSYSNDSTQLSKQNQARTSKTFEVSSQFFKLNISHVALGTHVLPDLWPNTSELSQTPSTKEGKDPDTGTVSPSLSIPMGQPVN